MGGHIHYFPELILTCTGLVALGLMFRRSAGMEHPLARRLIWLVLAAGAALVSSTLVLAPFRISAHFPNDFVKWTKGYGTLAAPIAVYCCLAMFAWRFLNERRGASFDPARRRLLYTATLSVPAAVTGFAIIKRSNLRLTEVDIRVRNLPPDLNGLKLVQITDLHMSPFVSEGTIARAVDMANETRAHIALVTGDLVTDWRDPVDRCLVQLGRLRSDAGTFGCMGNHEIYASSEERTVRHGARLGMRFLRSESQVLQFGKSRLNLVGVDYQPRNEPYLVFTEELMQAGMPNILLSHNPDVFPVAAGYGFDLTVAGHTHGGQVNFEILGRHANVARFYTPYVSGLYQAGGSSVYVSTGVGTVGVPARIGAPPEVALIRLCAT